MTMRVGTTRVKVGQSTMSAVVCLVTAESPNTTTNEKSGEKAGIGRGKRGNMCVSHVFLCLSMSI